MSAVSDLKKIQRNIPKVYALNFFMMFLVTIPIIVPYWKQFGLNLKDIYQLQAIFGFMMILLDVPAGYVSDLFGRKKCLIIVGCFNALSFQFLLNGKTFWHFALFEISAAIGLALYSGCDIALLYDSLDALDAHNDIEKINHSKSFLGKRIFYSQVGESVASLLGGALAIYSLRLPAMVNAVTAWVPLCIALTIAEPPRKTFESKKHFENFKIIYNSLFKHSKLLTFLVIFNIVYGFSTFAAVWAYQSYWQEIKIPVSYFGTLWALFNLSVAFLARYSHWIETKLSSLIVVLIVAISPVIAYLGLGLTSSLASVLFLLFFAIIRALNGVVLQDGINSRVPPTMRATTNSICGLGMRAIFFFFGPWFGHLLDERGVHYSFQMMGFVFIGIFFLVALPLINLRAHYRN
ncbi:MAG: MFS transporter [Bacteriovorax sp.]